MKNVILVITLTILSFAGYSQVQPARQPESSKVQESLIKVGEEPASWLNDLNYDYIKKLLQNRPKANYNKLIESISSLVKIDENKITESEIRIIENVLLDLYSLTNQEVGELLSMCRKNNVGTTEKLEKQSQSYIQLADEAFKQENVFLAQLNQSNVNTNNALLRKSFDDYFDIVLDYAECMACCPKKEFPDQRFFWFKPKYGKSITFSKAEYSAWYSHKICGFVIYNFPYSFKKSRFKLASIPGLLLTGLCGRPRFRNLSPNGIEVHVPMIPVIMVLGLNSLSTPPCQNQALQNKLLGIVQVKN